MTPLAESQADRQRVLTEATLRAADILGLSGETLAKIIGVSAASVSRMQTGEFRLAPDTKPWQLSALLVRLYRGLDAITAGDENSLRAWMRSANADLHGTPQALITDVGGLVDTVAYVDAHRARV